MRKSFLRKASIVLLSATMLMATACNKEIEVKYDYNVNDYVQLGKYEDIAVTVDKTSIENQGNRDRSHYYEAGNCNGSIHRDCARRIGGRPEYICESVYQAIGKRRVKYNKYGAKT